MADVKDADLPALKTIKDCLEFLGFSEALSKAVKTFLTIEEGAHPRDIGSLDYNDYKAVSVAIKVATSATEERDLTLVERGKVKSLYDLCAVVCGKASTFEAKARSEAAAAKAAAAPPASSTPAKPVGPPAK